MQDLQHRRLQTDTFLEFARIVAEEHMRLRARFDASGLDGITPGQSRVLMILFQAREPVTARVLAQRMGVSDVTMSRFVKGLAAAGWVSRERDPGDGRAFRLSVTGKAREQFPAFVRVSNEMLDELFCGFSPAEVSALADVVRRMRENLDQSR